MEDLSLHILDVVENATAAGATLIEIRIHEDSRKDRMVITIKDNGQGMDGEMVTKVKDPFCTTRTTRRVGMGIPLLEQSAREAGGSIEITSEPNVGTEVVASFCASHIDRKPLGDIAATMVALILGNPDVDFIYQRSIDGVTTDLDTREIKEQLDGVSITAPPVLNLIQDLLSATPEGEDLNGSDQTASS
ncbi:MAG: sensor histidine kinase [Candidatus Eisenbacteria sp.]|nr:sensor histidine kinase [Candidatus Eisenbacteria bacterium]